jgi:ADP-heptose:LPS heptosyltransferase
MPPASPTRALAIHPGALGDVLLAIPALRALRATGGRRAPPSGAAPSPVAVTLAAQPRIGALLVALGEVDEAVAFDTLGLEALFSAEALATDARVVRRLSAVDRVVCWFGSRDPDFVRRLCAIAPDAVVAPPSSSTMSVWQHLRRSVEVGVPDRAHATSPPPSRRVEAAGHDGAAESALSGAAGDRAPVAVSTALRDQGRQALHAAGWDGVSRVVVVHPGAGGTAKRWPVDGFLDVIAEVDATIVVHEGPADADAARSLLARAGVRSPRVIALVDPSLPLLAGVLAEAAAYLGNDSGVSHLAAAVGTPSVVLFTPPALPWVPWSPSARCLTVNTAALAAADRDAVRAALVALT